MVIVVVPPVALLTTTSLATRHWRRIQLQRRIRVVRWAGRADGRRSRWIFALGFGVVFVRFVAGHAGRNSWTTHDHGGRGHQVVLMETGPSQCLLMVMMKTARLVVNADRFGRRIWWRVVADATHRHGAVVIVVAAAVVVVVVAVGIRRGRRNGDGGNGSLLLHETVEFEPIGSSAVTGAALGHAHQEAFAQSAGLARRPVLLVDDALTAILALWYHRQVVVRSTEERLKFKQKGKKNPN